MSLGGVSKIFIELTSKCDKRTLCAMCGHQSPEINKNLKIGEMSLELLRDIRRQVPSGVEIAWHKDGDPLAYSRVGDALKIFDGYVSTVVTHGLNLGKKFDEIIENCTTVVVSVFRGDPDRELQLAALWEYMEKRNGGFPRIIVKVVGDMTDAELSPYWECADDVIHRLIHVPLNNSKYAHRSPTKPESMICQDFLHVPSIAWDGAVSICNRLDVQKHGVIGNLYENTLEEIWNGPVRQRMLDAHKAGRRDLANELCKTCEFWGVASQ